MISKKVALVGALNYGRHFSPLMQFGRHPFGPEVTWESVPFQRNAAGIHAAVSAGHHQCNYFNHLSPAE